MLPNDPQQPNPKRFWFGRSICGFILTTFIILIFTVTLHRLGYGKTVKTWGIIATVLICIPFSALIPYQKLKILVLNLCISLCSIFILAEIYFRVSRPEVFGAQTEDNYRYFSPYIMYKGKPGAHFKEVDRMSGQRNAVAEIELNELGFHFSKKLGMQKNPEEYRILMVGGSTTFNGNPESMTVPSLLEAALHRMGLPSVQVYNFGVISANSAQHLALITHLLSDYNPDLVLVYDGFNDVMGYEYDPRPGYPTNFLALETAFRESRGDPSAGHIFYLLFSSSRMIRFLLGPVLNEIPTRALRFEVGFGTETWEQLWFTQYLENHRKICQFGKGRGFKTGIFLQPAVSLFPNPTESPQTHFTYYMRRFYQAARERHQRDSLFKKSSEDCRFWDISDIFTSTESRYFWDVCHTDNKGNEIIAQNMARRLLPFIQKETRHPGEEG